jgi:hypothetical protein
LVILDTPLLTYRDPLRTPRFGDLSDDERVLAGSPVKLGFFEHLASLRGIAQFVIFENVDPPPSVSSLANVVMFVGETGAGRTGLFPKRRA